MEAIQAADFIPDAAGGWNKVSTSVFSAAIGPIWMRGERGAREIVLPTTAAIANDHMRVVHGGALMTFADIALGTVAVDAIGAPRCTTAQLNYHFVRGVNVGVLLTARPELVRLTRKLVFTRSLFFVEEDIVGSADGVFNIYEG